MAVPHARPGEVIDIAPLGSRLRHEQTKTLIKTDSLEVLRLVLPAGKQIAPHAVAGEVTVHCLEGKVIFGVRGQRHELTAGKLLYLAGNDQHELESLEDASLLVTILLTPKSSSERP